MRSRLLLVLVILAVALAGDLPPGGASATSDAVDYADTIAFTAVGFPDGTGFGGATGLTTLDGDVQQPLGGNEGLLGTDNRGQFFPDFAAEVPSQANGGITMVGGNEVVTLRLKPGLRWSDGSPITPADYVAWFVFALSPEINAQSQVAPIRAMRADEHQIVITYNGIYAPAFSYGLPSIFPFEYFNRKYHTAVPASVMASYDPARIAALYASPSYRGSDLRKMILGWLDDHYNSPTDLFDGPYKLAEWAPDQRVTEVPNPYYTALPPDPHHPRPAKIQFLVLSRDLDAYRLALGTGSSYDQLDLAEGFGFDTLGAPIHNKYRLVVTPFLDTIHLELNQAAAPLRDQRVRLALSLAVDRARYLAAVYPGLDPAVVRAAITTSFVPNSSPWSDRDLPRNPYDPERARSLLAAAGYATIPGGPGRPLRLTLTVFSGALLLRSAQLLQRFWGQVGVSVGIQAVPPFGPNSIAASYQDGGVFTHRRFQIAQIGIASGIDPDGMATAVDPAQIPDAAHPLGSNYAGIVDPALARLFAQARQTLDERIRHRIYDEVQREFAAQAYWIVLFNDANVLLTKGTIGNFAPNPVGSNLWNVFEWYRVGAA